jgi:hypothetical protein
MLISFVVVSTHPAFIRLTSIGRKPKSSVAPISDGTFHEFASLKWSGPMFSLGIPKRWER